MREIVKLDKLTIDKIAAGEVIERPASVVKELAENAIDAQASAVTVEIREGGKQLIRVTDNGSGIHKDQLRSAFLRHATSKIKKAEDLHEIASLGFRGEALSSIAAVSRVEMITRTKGALEGVRILLSGGEEESFSEIGAPEGTSIYVRDLFFNTPARERFLKGTTSEANQVTAVVEELALSHPEISFKLVTDGRERIFTSGDGQIEGVAYQIFGREHAKSLVAIDKKDSLVQIEGLVGLPEASRANRSFEKYFVNGRYCKNKVITAAIEEAYAGRLMQHRFPFVLLYLTIDTKLVDVNVHPTKREVRIGEETEIHAQIRDAIRSALDAREQISELRLTDPERSDQPENKQKEPVVKSPEPFEQRRRASELAGAGILREKMAVYGVKTPEAIQDARKDVQHAPIDVQHAPIDVQHAPKEAQHTQKEAQQKYEQAAFFSEESRAHVKIIGQAFRTYWIAEFSDALYIIDQHAAHEKVLYERLMRDYREKTIKSQLLMPAAVFSLSAREEACLLAHMEAFSALGFAIEAFGAREYKLSEVPSNLYRTDGKALFRDILDQIGTLGERPDERVLSRIASMSCKAAVKGNQRMSSQEAEALIDELFTLEDPYHCPHGRPTIIKMTERELEKRFKRIV